MLQLKVFALFNKNYSCVEGVFTSVNASLAIRDNFQSWSQLYPALVDDYSLVEIGSVPREAISAGHIELSPCEPVVHDWSSFGSEIEYVPKHLSERQKELMRQQTQSQLDQLTQLQERIERTKMLSGLSNGSKSEKTD